MTPASRLLRQFDAARYPSGGRDLEIAALPTSRSEQCPDTVPVAVDQHDLAVARDDADHRFGRARRRKGAGKTAAVLLVDRHREGNAVQSRSALRRSGMMGIAALRDDRLALSLPGAAQVGKGVLG